MSEPYLSVLFENPLNPHKSQVKSLASDQKVSPTSNQNVTKSTRLVIIFFSKQRFDFQVPKSFSTDRMDSRFADSSRRNIRKVERDSALRLDATPGSGECIEWWKSGKPIMDRLENTAGLHPGPDTLAVVWPRK